MATNQLDLAVDKSISAATTFFATANQPGTEDANALTRALQHLSDAICMLRQLQMPDAAEEVFLTFSNLGQGALLPIATYQSP
jgi:hypothetical protein